MSGAFEEPRISSSAAHQATVQDVRRRAGVGTATRKLRSAAQSRRPGLQPHHRLQIGAGGVDHARRRSQNSSRRANISRTPFPSQVKGKIGAVWYRERCGDAQAGDQEVLTLRSEDGKKLTPPGSRSASPPALFSAVTMQFEHLRQPAGARKARRERGEPSPRRHIPPRRGWTRHPPDLRPATTPSQSSHLQLGVIRAFPILIARNALDHEADRRDRGSTGRPGRPRSTRAYR